MNRVLELVVVQPTPFCNIDCDYCYLPERSVHRAISSDTLNRAFTRLFSLSALAKDLEVVWHAGEPTTLPIQFYRRTFETIEALRNQMSPQTAVRHHIQTNATLLNDEWCDLFAEWSVSVGVSFDGPQDLHDARRKRRSGKGTYIRVAESMDLLRRRGIEFTVITVVTADLIHRSDDLYACYRQHGVKRVGLNVEEVTGNNLTSSLTGSESESGFRNFLARLLELNQRAGRPVVFREEVRVRAWINNPEFDGKSQLVAPLSILTIGWNGDFSTYCPELLTLRTGTYGGSFVLGNVHRDDIESAVYHSEKGRMMLADVAAGVKMCEDRCEYFMLCGGGAPSNKYFENGTFRSDETAYCRTAKKAVIDTVLGVLEREAADQGASGSGDAR